MSILEKTTLKAVLMVVTGATATIATNGAILPFSFNGRNVSFLLTLDPSSVTLTQGSYATSTITLISINGFSGNVNLYANGTLPASFSANPISVPADGTATAMLTVSTSSDTSLGSYSMIIIGIGTGQKRTISSSALFIAQVTSNADFTLTANPSSINNLAGETNTTTITLTSHNNFNGSVSLAFTAPFGYISVMGGQNPISLTPNSSAITTLQITTQATTPDGTYTITVTGTSGLKTYSTSLIVSVIDPASEAILLTGYLFNSSTNLTLYLQNTGNTTISLQSYTVRDSQGNAWTQPNLNSPAIAIGDTSTVNVLIWTDCPTCNYTGILGLFTEYVAGRTYTIVLTTTNDTQFTITITR